MPAARGGAWGTGDETASSSRRARSAELAMPRGSLNAGATMTAQFAMFFELRDGLICGMRNYDCFEPW